MPLTRLRALVESRAPSRPLGLARIGLGTAALLKLVATVPVLARLQSPTSLRAPFVDWLPYPQAPLLPVLTLGWCAAAVAFALGWRTRAAGLALGLVLAYVLILDQQLYSNHLYLLLLLVLLVTVGDGGAALSLDARRRGARQSVTGWPVALLKLQVSIVYLFAALAKLNLYFLSGAMLAAYLRRGGLLTLPEPLLSFPVVTLLAVAAVATEGYLAFALWTPRRQVAALVIGLTLHLCMVLTLSPTLDLVVFAVELLALYPLFLVDRKPAGTIWTDPKQVVNGLSTPAALVW
jgi:hypothetical protein